MIGPVTTIVPCVGISLPVPTFVYSCENGTGASLLETSGLGNIHNTPCGPAGQACGSGAPTMGPQMGVRPTSITVGVSSHINALTSSLVCTHILEPQQHVMPVFPGGAPAGSMMIDYNNPFLVSMILVSLPAPTVPVSFPVAPFSQNCFPDLYTAPVIVLGSVPMGFGSFPMIAIPPLWTGKVLFQGVGFGSPGILELSTPTVIDVL
ncbi:MAG: hypothetical protein ACI89X_002589 [Planctomycetota bacterium]|jgi:hypothetical protein